MKYFPLKTVLFCLLIIPLLFTATLTYLERSLNLSYERKIQNHIVTQTDEIMNGTRSIYYAVDKDIRNFLENDLLVKIFRLQPYIRVVAKGGQLLYSQCGIDSMEPGAKEMLWYSGKVVPYVQPSDNFANQPPPDSPGTPKEGEQPDKTAIIHQDKTILAMGINVQVAMSIRENPLISNLSLFTYMGLSLSIFGFSYKKALSKVVREDLKRGQIISNLIRDERDYLEKLETLKKEREVLAEKLTEAKAYYQEARRIASIAEEELVEEIVQLEKKLDQNISSQTEKEQEIETLKSQLEKMERRKGGGKKRKSADVTQKRFENLYKNIEMNKKAIAGLLDLDDDMKIKAEEVIHLLNEDPSGVTVKRKVFAGKKNRTASFEVLFAYNGRLYFRNLEGNRVEILVIGTKNTQDKDMEFLHYI